VIIRGKFSKPNSEREVCTGYMITLVEPADLGMHGVYVARVLGRVFKDIVQMNILNISDEDRELPKNKLLDIVDYVAEDIVKTGRPEVSSVATVRKVNDPKVYKGDILEVIKPTSPTRQR
jgi:hypothetical protein